MSRRHPYRHLRVLTREHNDRSSSWIFAVTMLVLLSLIISACGPAEPDVSPELAETAVGALPTAPPEISSPLPLADETAVAGASDVTLDEIVTNPDAFAGQTVTVSGGVDEVRTERIFTIADSTLLDASEVLVGVAPSIAQTIVQLDVDLSSITTCTNLAVGLDHALRTLGLAIQPLPNRRHAEEKPAVTARTAALAV